MANDRMFLRCNTCGKQFMLAKNNGVEWYFRYSNEEYGDMLSEFLSKHGLCTEDQNPFLADRKHPFELVYESDDDYEIYNKNN